MEKSGNEMVSGAGELAGGDMASEGKGDRAGSRAADRQVMGDLLAQVRRITVIVEDLACREHARRIRDFQGRIAALEAYVTPSKWAVRFIGAFFQKTGWLFGALIMGSIGYGLYLAAVILLGKF